MRSKIKYTIALLILSSLFACNDTPKKKKDKIETKVEASAITTVKANKNIHNFGKMTQGEVLAYSFNIENTGKSSLLINNIETSCGCTLVKWDKKPLAPGEKTKIEVEFNSSGRYGKQYKVISIFANVPNKIYELIITAEVN
jgi:hypothetical protein